MQHYHLLAQRGTAAPGCVAGFSEEPRDPTIRDCSTNPPYLPPTVKVSTKELNALRLEMRRHNISAYIIPPTDPHLGEYTANREKRRQWLTGFTGSAGNAVVTLTRAAVFTDSRYWTQAERQMDCNWELQRSSQTVEVAASDMASWILEQLAVGDDVGFDPFLLSISEWESYNVLFEGSGRTLRPIPANLVDAVWGSERPPLPDNEIYAIPGDFVGLFNLRALDIPNNPYFYSYSLLTRDSIRLFVNVSRVPSAIRDNLTANCPGANCVHIAEYGAVQDALRDYVTGDVKVWIGAAYTNYGLYQVIPKTKLLSETYSPVMMTKAAKTNREQDLLRQCHVRDAVAVIEYLVWLERMVPTNTVTELSGADYVDGRRAKQEHFRGPSFSTISAGGLNAALPHYRPTNGSDRPLRVNEMYLVDSGGQYLDGTTDITRTMHWGTPTAFEKEAYTRVLIGNIELSRLVFPPRTSGMVIETIARRALWEAGLNFGHGTGHGIGNFFSVHECEFTGPVGFRSGNAAFTKGMFTSIEPGYYHDGQFGIRIEDIALAVEADTKYTFGGEKYLTFEKVTLVPYARNLIDTGLMTDVHRCTELTWVLIYHQIQHVNDYYEKIRRVMLPELQRQNLQDEYKWLQRNTEPLSHGTLAAAASLTLLTLSVMVALIGQQKRTTCISMYQLHVPACTMYQLHVPACTNYMYQHVPCTNYMYQHVPCTNYMYQHVPCTNYMYQHVPCTNYMYQHVPCTNYMYQHVPCTNYMYQHVPCTNYIYQHVPCTNYMYQHVPCTNYMYQHVPTTCTSMYNVPTTCTSMYHVPTTCTSMYHVPTTCTSMYNVPTTCTSMYHVPTTCTSMYHVPTTSTSMYHVPTTCTSMYHVNQVNLFILSGYSAGFAIEPRDPTIRNCSVTPPFLPTTAKNSTEELARLRQQMRLHNISAYIVPATDPHLGEYIADREKRRQWLSGFTGSAGEAVVTMTRAAVFTDSRYWTQAERQMDCNWELQKTASPSTIVSWILQEIGEGEQVGFDPFLWSINEWESYNGLFQGSGRILLSIPTNLVDVVWGNQRPPLPDNEIYSLPKEFVGNGWQEKVAIIREQMEKHSQKPTALLLSNLEETAWLFNLRGQDIPYNPFFYSYAMLTKTSISLFVNVSRISDAVRNDLSTDCPDFTCVQIEEYDKVRDTVLNYTRGDVRVWIGSLYTNYGVYEIIPKTKLVSESYSPVMMTKAAKNEREQRLLKDCHIRDAVAVIELLVWLEKTVPTNHVTELSSALYVDGKRGKQAHFKGPSFETISASGLNAALAHYSASNETNRLLSLNEMYLVDSGGQYLDGTTDITRTVHWGKPTDFEKEAYTRVLMGNIELSRLVFPPRTSGRVIEAFARHALWEAGLNYGHGTGHGVGNFFSVHEWPVGFQSNNVVMTKGMFTSIEPGYYHDGQFGIRIEDIVLVVEADTKHVFGGEKYLTFETVTLVPYDRNLINIGLMSDVQIQYVNDYYEKIRRVMLPELQRQNLQEEYKWLQRNTEPLSHGTLAVAASLVVLSLSTMVTLVGQQMGV
ncbi:uncharacterized protein PAF06_002460 [Gastrophryne carolinensis]